MRFLKYKAQKALAHSLSHVLSACYVSVYACDSSQKILDKLSKVVLNETEKEKLKMKAIKIIGQNQRENGIQLYRYMGPLVILT